MTDLNFNPTNEEFTVSIERDGKIFELTKREVVLAWEANFKSMLLNTLKDIENSGTDFIQQELSVEDKKDITEEAYDRFISSYHFDGDMTSKVEEVISAFGFDEPEED